MAVRDVDMYFRMIERLEAQEMLTSLKIQDFPNMKNDQRTKLHKRLMYIMNPEMRKESAITPEQMAQRLNQGR